MSIGASGSAQGSDSGTVSVSYRANYRAYCDDPLDTSPIVLTHFRQSGTLPWMGKTFALGNGIDASAVCRNVQVDPIENGPGMFNVTVGYESVTTEKEQNESEDGTSEDPLEWLDEIEISFTQTAVVAELGKFHGFHSALRGAIKNNKIQVGKTIAICNSAGVPYDPPVEKEKDIRVIRIMKHVREYDGLLFNKWNGRVNSDIVVINKPFYRYKDEWENLTAKIKVIGATFGRVNGKNYWRQTIEVHIDRDGWRKRILDRGMAARREADDPDGSGNTLSNTDEVDAGKSNHHQNTDSNGYSFSEPLNFDGNGQPLRSASYPPVYGEWGVYEEIAFAPLAGKAW